MPQGYLYSKGSVALEHRLISFLSDEFDSFRVVPFSVFPFQILQAAKDLQRRLYPSLLFPMGLAGFRCDGPPPQSLLLNSLQTLGAAWFRGLLPSGLSTQSAVLFRSFPRQPCPENFLQDFPPCVMILEPSYPSLTAHSALGFFYSFKPSPPSLPRFCVQVLHYRTSADHGLVATSRFH